MQIERRCISNVARLIKGWRAGEQSIHNGKRLNHCNAHLNDGVEHLYAHWCLHLCGAWQKKCTQQTLKRKLIIPPVVCDNRHARTQTLTSPLVVCDNRHARTQTLTSPLVVCDNRHARTQTLTSPLVVCDNRHAQQTLTSPLVVCDNRHARMRWKGRLGQRVRKAMVIEKVIELEER